MPDEQRYLSHAERTVRAAELQARSLEKLANAVEQIAAHSDLVSEQAWKKLKRSNEKERRTGYVLGLDAIEAANLSELECAARLINVWLEEKKKEKDE